MRREDFSTDGYRGRVRGREPNPQWNATESKVSLRAVTESSGATVLNGSSHRITVIRIAARIAVAG